MTLPVPPLRGRPDDSELDAISSLLHGDVESTVAVLSAVDGLQAGDLDALAGAMRDHDPASVALAAIALLAVTIEPEPGPAP
jgi:hypothetical protein